MTAIAQIVLHVDVEQVKLVSLLQMAFLRPAPTWQKTVAIFISFLSSPPVDGINNIFGLHGI